MKISGMLVDIHTRDIYPAVIHLYDGRIAKIERVANAPEVYIMPGLIDSHIHIESSMITPGAFSLTAVRHGTTAVISDPHEIGNVLGIEGVDFMISDSLKVPVNFWFGAPSCVPATKFESSGAVLSSEEVEILLEKKEIKYLAEMMNFPGVIYGDSEVRKKMEIARKYNKPIDGHAPGLTGENLKKYISAGITTDHECSSLSEAIEKISLGMKILIREGSAARNLDSLKDLFNTHPEMVMLCSDDLHPEMLEERHINKLIALLISEGYDIFDVIRSATINPVKHYNIESGLLIEGDEADFIIVDNPGEMNVIETWIKGKKVFSGGKALFKYKPGKKINKFNCSPIVESNISVIKRTDKVRLIEAFDGELVTKEIIHQAGNSDIMMSDTENDILKIIVKDRYKDKPAAVGFIKGFGLKKGAFASSIAHDSHNIISIGTNDRDIVIAVNEVIRNKGGLSVSSGNTLESLQLNIGGIMTTRSCSEVAKDYKALSLRVKDLGCTMSAPFMTLSFMALLVIPELKISDMGLFDGKKFDLVSLFVE